MIMSLDAAFDPDITRAQAAVDEVFQQICPQETLESDALSVLPELIGLLDARQLHIKPFVLSVLGTIWELTVEEEDVPGIFPAAVDFVPEEQRHDDNYSELLESARHIFEERLSSFTALLRDRDPAVRSRAARVVALTRAHRAEAARLVADAYNVEELDEIRATQILSLGVLGSLPRRDEETELCRSCRVIAEVWSQPANANNDTWAALEQIANSPRLNLEYFRWLRGAIAGMAADALARLLSIDRSRAAQALIRSIRFQATGGPEASGAEPGEDWPLPQLMSEYFVFRALKAFDRRGSEVLPGELDAFQRSMLGEIGADLGIFTWAQRRCGIPLRPLDLDRYLGRRPAGPLDATMSLAIGARSADWPLWKWSRFAHRNQLEEVLVDSLEDRMARSDLWALYKDVATGVYDPTNRGPDAPVPLATRLAQREQLRDLSALEAYAYELLSAPPAVSEAAAAMIPLLELAREAGHNIPMDLDPLIETLVRAGGGPRRQVLDLLPPDRRIRFEQIAVRQQAIPENIRRFIERRGTMPGH